MTATKPKKPHVPKELLAWLKFCFPDKAPGRDDTDREVWIKVGQVEVVRHLQRLLDEQEKNTNVLR